MSYDIFMIAYGEPNAGENWQRLRHRAPEARLIENVQGAFSCYAACAAAARTPFFFSVDADNWVLDGFNFEVDFEPRTSEIAMWQSRNPVNGLEYGHGAIKLFPTASMLASAKRGGFDQAIDFPTLVPANRYIRVCASEHRFNGDAYSSWAAAFRECAKLALATRLGRGPEDRKVASFWLKAWCTRRKPEAAYGDWCLRGAAEGRAFGLEHLSDLEELGRCINDYAWLRARFREQHVRRIPIPTSTGES